MPKEKQADITAFISKYRICISGSSSLTKNIYDKWLKISEGIPLLERYGMSETGMIISNPLSHKHRKQVVVFKKGYVGFPLPSVEVRLFDDTRKAVIYSNGVSGEIQTRSPLIFKEYFNDEEATRKAFTSDGW